MLLGPVNVDRLVEWIKAVPFTDWPQQHRVDGQIRPAMVTDLSWHGFGDEIRELVRQIVDEHFPDCTPYQRMLSVVMPGHWIAPHVDGQSSYWITRVHLPLTTNDFSHFIVDKQPLSMKVGFAYRVDTTVEHAVTNGGSTPRIHFMFDVGKE